MADLLMRQYAEPVPQPPVEEQVAAIEQTLSAVTRVAVEKLCERLDLDLLSMEFLPEGEPGCTFVPPRPFNVNPNWVLEARARGEGGATKAYVLQVTNPHAWRRQRNTHAKVGAMKWLRQCGLPLVPAVVAWSADSSTSPIGCEFVLMERMPGVQLRSVWSDLSTEVQSKYRHQLLEWACQLGSVSKPTGAPDVAATFHVQPDGTVVCDAPPCASNGPPLSVSAGFSGLTGAVVADALNRVHQSAYIGEYKDLVPGLQDVLDFIVEYHRRYEADAGSRSTSCASFGVCHGDLHTGNVLCDPDTTTITGVIDWEDVDWGPRDVDAMSFEEDFACGADDGLLPNTVGASERRAVMRLLPHIRFLHFLSATWWGHVETMEGKLQAAADEASGAAEAVREALKRFRADVQLCGAS